MWTRQRISKEEQKSSIVCTRVLVLARVGAQSPSNEALSLEARSLRIKAMSSECVLVCLLPA